ncbi:sperm acrosome membrane-associated protein 4-like [Gadus macrocephalus]|uniref:sperm acrosome membrane-associated protein 4-like n=1 Tax=Gadus macrocephalus TaxID=80720 RepID=UPI0028CB6DB9|nr:sperm acrosome membrane-associated protein 4-like [Gadus macrocephalus]
MKQIIFFVLAITLLPHAQGEEEEDQPETMEEVRLEEEDLLECFRCDLGFWDACYTTRVYCSPGERCFTGRGKAVDLLDVKTLGCVKTEECSAETSLELYPNATLYTMTKHCCDTAFCNAARPARPVGLCSYLTGPALGLWYLTGPPPRLH